MDDLRKVHFGFVIVAFLLGYLYGWGLVQAIAANAGEEYADCPVSVGGRQ